MNTDVDDLDEREYIEEAANERRQRHRESEPLLSDAALSNGRRKPSIFWLLPPYFFAAVMSGAAITPRLSLISNLLCRSYYASRNTGLNTSAVESVFTLMNSQANCNIPTISGQIARMSTSLNTVTGLLSAITAAKYGVLSDRYGRRYPLMLAMLGSLLNDLTYILVSKYYDHLSIYFLIIGAICDGITGSYMSLLAATYAYATDVVSPARRAVAFGYFQCCFYGGIAIGPTLGGYIVKRTNNVLIIFYLAMVVHGVFALYTIFILPESLSPQRRMAAKAKHEESKRQSMNAMSSTNHMVSGAQTFLQFFNIFKVLSVFVPKNGRPVIKRNLLLLMAIDICLLLNLGMFTIIILYGKLMFDWGDLQQGYLLSIVGGTRVVMLLAVLPVIVRLVRGKAGGVTSPLSSAPSPSSPVLTHDGEHPPHGADALDIWLIRVSMVLEIVGFSSFAMAGSSTGYYVAGGLSALAGIGMPTLASAFTKHVPSTQTGQLLGAVALMQSLNRVCSPLFFGLLYAATVDTHPATAFVLMASLMCIGLGLSAGLRPCSESDDANDNVDA